MAFIEKDHSDKIDCPKCHKLYGIDLMQSVKVDYSSNILNVISNTSSTPELAIEIKCGRCKTYFTCYGGVFRHVGVRRGKSKYKRY